jgi:DNA-binding LacI/PurR family transcriptional regulator
MIKRSGERSPSSFSSVDEIMSKRVTLKQVALAAGVSYQTVSKVLNHQKQVSPETAARIWSAADILGYHPDDKARNLRLRRSRMIGYSWNASSADPHNPQPNAGPNLILDRFLQSMVETAGRAGYYILPFPPSETRDPIAAYRSLMNTGRVDGFVLSSVTFDDPRLAFLQEQGFPFVAFGRSNPECEFPYVDVDGAAGLRMATEHLIRQGHCAIAALAWRETSRVGQDRLEGYRQALEAAGISPQAPWIARGEGRVAFGYAATQCWLDLPASTRPTGIVALNDLMAIGAMRAAQERGLSIGTDLAIVGFDDLSMVQYLTPALSSVRQPIWQVGQLVVDMLYALLEGKPVSNPHILLPPELIVRESSGLANAIIPTKEHYSDEYQHQSESMDN